MFTRVVRTVGVLLLAVAPVKAQSLMYRPPNLGGTWVPEGGVVQFNFVHRFYVAPAVGGHKVTNFPPSPSRPGSARASPWACTTARTPSCR